MMWKLFLTFLFIILCVVTNAFNEENIKTLHGYKDPPDGRQKTFTFNAESSAGHRQKRNADNLIKKPPLFDNGIITKVSDFVIFCSLVLIEPKLIVPFLSKSN